MEAEPPSFSWNQMDETVKKNLLVTSLNSSLMTGFGSPVKKMKKQSII